MVALFLGGLKERSVFAMALQDRKATGTYWERGGAAAHGTSREGWLSHIQETPGKAQRHEHPFYGVSFSKVPI